MVRKNLNISPVKTRRSGVGHSIKDKVDNMFRPLEGSKRKKERGAYDQLYDSDNGREERETKVAISLNRYVGKKDNPTYEEIPTPIRNESKFQSLKRMTYKKVLTYFR